MLKKNILSIILILLFSCAIAQKKQLATVLDEFKTDPKLKNASISFVAIDIDSGKVIAQLNPDLSVSPASTLKLFSTATVLELYGDTYRYETQLQYDGTIDKATRILHGNIYIKGSGDPALGSDYFPDYYNPFFIDTWVEKIKQLGIDSINGLIIGDAQIYSDNILPRMREWEAMANYYGAGACGLNIYDNIYRVTFRSPAETGKLTEIKKIEPPQPDILFDNRVLSSEDDSDNAYIFGAPYSNYRTIYGTIPKAKNEFTIKGAISDPALFTAYELSKRLFLAGVKLDTTKISTIRHLKLSGKNTENQRFTIHSTFSPTLSELINRTNKISFNLYAEHFINHVGLKTYNYGDAETGANAVVDFWKSKGMDTDGLFIRDGSGLARANMVTANQMVYLLSYMKTKSIYAETFYESLPVAGESGTMRNVCKGTVAAGNLRAKSGSIDKVRTYTGYVITRSKRFVAFALLVNNYTCSSAQMRDKLEKMMTALAEISY